MLFDKFSIFLRMLIIKVDMHNIYICRYIYIIYTYNTNVNAKYLQTLLCFSLKTISKSYACKLTCNGLMKA